MASTPESQVVRFDTTADSSQSSQRNNSSQLKSTSWPTRRYTPYTKTPRSRKLNKRMGRVERTPVSINDSDVDLRKLVNKTWHVYKVTPLANFKHDVASLRKYSKHLSAFLQADSQKGIGVDVENNVGDRAVFSVMKGLASSPDDCEAVELTVKVKSQVNGASDRVTLHAILCSVCADFNLKEKLDDSLVMLPVMIVKGTVGVSKCVIKWLQSQFDCYIRRMTFNQMTLAWTVSMWAGVTLDSIENVGKPIELQYTVPKDIEGLNTITLTVEHQDAQRLWESVHDSDSEEITEEEVAAFIKSLEEHFFHHFKIHLEGMSLTRIGTPLAFMGCEGRLKILQATGVTQVLQYLTELATEDNFGL